MKARHGLFVFLIVLLFLDVYPVFASSLVGTSATTFATQYPHQRKIFYANGRFWIFYADKTNMVYATSTDGISWSSPTAVRASTYGTYFSVWFDGTYLHYAYAATSSIYYRRGYPSSDGTITWSTDTEQTVSTTYNKAIYPFVSVDSNGYAWIGYRDYTGTYYYPYVIKSQYNNGTWGITPSGFPYQLSSTSNSGWKVSIIPLTAGKMLAIYAYNGITVRVKRWNSSSWGAERATTSAVYNGYYFSAVAQGDNVHLMFLKSTGYDILYTKYVYTNDAFSSEVTVKAGATSASAPVLSIDDAGKLYCFWATTTTGSPSGATANHIYYQTSTDGGSTWSAMVDWINEETEVLTGSYTLTCFYKQYGTIGLVYMTNTTSPYNVKFAFLTVEAPPTEYAFYGDIPLTFTLGGIKSFSFVGQGIIPLTFTFLSTITQAITKNFYGSIPLAFSFGTMRAFGFNSFGNIPITFTIESMANFVSTTLLSLFGTIPLTFSIESLKAMTFNLFGSIPLTFTFEGTAGFIYGTLIRIYGTIPLTFAFETLKAINLNIFGTISLQLAIQATTTLTLFITSFLLATLAFIFALVSFCGTQTGTKAEILALPGLVFGLGALGLANDEVLGMGLGVVAMVLSVFTLVVAATKKD